METLRSRRALLFALQSALGIGLLATWLTLVDLSAVGKILSQARWPLVILAAILMIGSTVLRLIRWQTILRSIQKVPLLELWKISAVASLVNFLVPLRTGELARSLLLKRRHSVPVSASLPSIGFDRVFDLGAILLIGGMGALSGVRLDSTLLTVLASGTGLLLLFGVFIYVVVRFRAGLLALVGKIIPSKLEESLKERLLLVIGEGLRVFSLGNRRVGNIVIMSCLSLGGALLDAASFYCLFASLGFSVSPMTVVTGYALFMLTLLVPAAPGYIGSMEAFGSLVFCALGVGEAASASMIVLNHALNVVVLGLTGGLGLALFRAGGDVSAKDLGWSERAPQPAHDADRLRIGGHLRGNGNVPARPSAPLAANEKILYD